MRQRAKETRHEFVVISRDSGSAKRTGRRPSSFRQRVRVLRFLPDARLLLPCGLDPHLRRSGTTWASKLIKLLDRETATRAFGLLTVCTPYTFEPIRESRTSHQ